MKLPFTLFALLLLTGLHAQNNVPVTAAKWADTTDGHIKIEAKFPGGPQGWIQYLQKNLHPEVAAENIVLKRRQKDSTETIIVSFLVDTTGKVSEVKVENLNPYTPAVAAEAKRVVARGPNWDPASIDGKKVVFRQKQSISFMISSR